MATNLSPRDSAAEEGMKKFYQKCDEVIFSKYILAEKKISDFVKVIATEQVLYTLFSSLVEKHNFAMEFEKAKVVKNSHRALVLPESIEKKALIVFCVLYELDFKKRRLDDFLNEFFFDAAGVNAEYAKFCADFIAPFRDCVEILVNGYAAQNAPVAAKEAELDVVKCESMVAPVREIIRLISTEEKIQSVRDKENILTVAEGLIFAINTKNRLLIKPLYVALKCLSGFYPVNASVPHYLDDVYDLLCEFELYF